MKATLTLLTIGFSLFALTEAKAQLIEEDSFDYSAGMLGGGGGTGWNGG